MSLFEIDAEQDRDKSESESPEDSGGQQQPVVATQRCEPGTVVH